MSGEIGNRARGLKIPYNWDFAVIKELGAINRDARTKHQVVEIYAADRFSLTGSGRTASTVYDRKLPLRAYVEEARRHGIAFEYLWNAITLGGREWDPEFQERLYQEATELVEAGIASITVSHPLLSLKLKTWFPHLRVSSSVNNHLDSVEKIEQFIQYTGTDRIMLDHRSSRNFGLISSIHQKFPDKPIIVLVNEACLPDCVLQSYHQEHTANASRLGEGYKAPDLCRILCTAAKLKNPLYTLKAPWVRPEDIGYLFDAGAEIIKLAGRTESSEWIVRLATAYGRGEYEGDVWQLIEKPGSVRPEWETVLKKKLEPCRYTVDNKSLDGFIVPFVNGAVPCVKGNAGCGDCTWCDSWMNAVTIPENIPERLDDIEVLLGEVRSGGPSCQSKAA